jgi:polysaccharide export outer membrane protein
MPFTRRALLLVEIAALAVLSAAGAGCQTSTGQLCPPTGCAGDCLPANPTGASTIWRASGASGPAYGVAHRTTQEPPSLGEPDGARCSCAEMGRPVVTTSTPASPAPDEGPALQRVSGEFPVVSSNVGVTRLDSRDQSNRVALVPALRPEGEPQLPAPNLIDSAAAPPPGSPLPPPRLVPKPDPKVKAKARPAVPEGFPNLPPPLITHPPAAPREFAMRALSTYPIEPPDVLQIDLSPAVGDKNFPIRGIHLVRPDGTIGLGPVGHVFVAGMTLDQAKAAIAQRLAQAYTSGGSEDERQKKFRDILEGLKVDVAAYNSKFYYVITDGGGFGEQVYRVLCTGNERVLDAIAQITGLPAVASKSQIWVARATPTEVDVPNILPVDWRGITMNGSAATNYQIYPGDRIYINSDKLIRVDSFLAKVISPIERLFGITLLGTTTVHSFKSNGGTTR